MEKYSVSRAAPGADVQKPFVKVVPPTVHAGVGNALKAAFCMDSNTRCLDDFEDLLRRLD